ncbi:hypothetical protein ERJ75_000676600 [Trypanosoma vivax]|nr:hypothetical protein ERJ75_000676600 [Trypanosoma vivax]
MYVARATKAPHAPEMKIPSNRRSTFQPITEGELDVALRELSSGTAPGDNKNHCEEPRQGGKEVRAATVQLEFAHRAGASQVEARHHSPAAEA